MVACTTVTSRRLLATVAAVTLAGCSSISTVRVQPDSVGLSGVGPNMRPIAVVHAQVTSAYFLFIPIPGGVSLDRVVNRMLLASAKALGADKVVDIRVDITPDDGIWTLRKVLGWRSAEASGIAVIMEEPTADAPALPNSGSAK